jgi:anti-sigma factor (TIGR02949 family)
MDCAKARFLLYAYLDREFSSAETEALARHLTSCPSCETRSRAARSLARVLRSRVDRATAPHRLRLRLRQAAAPVVRPRYPVFAMAAAILLMILPLAADESVRHVHGVLSAAAATPGMPARPLSLVSRRVTGTLVCLRCEARQEAGLCPLPHQHHEPALCADDGEVWRLMARDPSFSQASTGQTVTVEGVAFPQSGFLRASRVGY